MKSSGSIIPSTMFTQRSPLGRSLPAFVITLIALIGLMMIAPAQGHQASGESPRQAWNAAQKPFNIYGNTHYVGVHGLSAILITSSEGHVLIDGALPESAAPIAAHIRELGFRVEDVKLILNSHVHFDHAGGIAELQRLSGATVAASESSAEVIKTGGVGRDDPQYGTLSPIAAVAAAHVKTVKDGETLHVGPIALTAHLTPGHTRGGTSWTWQSCEKSRCLNIVYADSLTAVSAENFLFTNSREYPHALQDFEKSFATVSALPCDILLTPHPEVSGLWEKIGKRDQGAGPDALVDPAACGHFVDGARERLRKRVADERARAR